MTNRYNLPSGFVNLCNAPRTPMPHRYSVTELLKPRWMVNLMRANPRLLDGDVSDQVLMILGTAVHKVLEEHTSEGFAERKIERVVGEDTLVGVIDLYNPDTYTIEDYKVTTTRHTGTDEWRLQGLMYAWLLRPEYVDRLRFHAILRDWSYHHDGPAVWTWEYKVMADDMAYIEAYIKTWLSNTEPCTPSERWNDGDTWWLYKDGNVRATHQCASDTVAPKGYHVVYRVGVDKRCERWCPVASVCKAKRERL